MTAPAGVVLGALSLAAPWGLALLGLAVPIVALHMLKPRRRTAEVSSTLLWQSVATPVSAASPWQPLRRSLLLALQLAVVAVLAVAVARPVTTEPGVLAAHTVFVIDTSGSMAALDGSPDRLAAAVDRARDLRGDLPLGGVASIVEAGVRPRVVLTASPDRAAFDDALGALRTTEGATDWGTAFTLAASLETSDAPIGFVLVSDGGLPDEARGAIPPGTRYEPVGEEAANRAVTRLVVEPRGSGLHAVVTVANTGGPTVTQTLRVQVDGESVATRDLRLGAGEAVDVDLDLPAGERVEAFLEGDDLLVADDHARAVAPQRREVRVRHVGPENVFLDGLLGAMEGVTVERADAAGPADADADLVIYDRVDPPPQPVAPFVAIAPPGGVPGTDPAGGVLPAGEVEFPVVALVRSDDDLLDGVDVADLAVALAQRLDAPTAEVLLGAEGAPLLVRSEVGGVRYLYLAFALEDSTLPLLPAFPIIVDRAIADLGGAAVPPGVAEVGDTLPVDARVETTVVDPAGRRTAVAPGSLAPVADRPGFWSVEVEGRPTRLVAVNPSAAESRLAPEPALPIALAPEGRGAAAADVERSALAWVIPPLLALLVVEWLVARRAVGVGRRQWRSSLALRVGVAALAVAALVAPSLERREGRVATVFVIDASDSLGPAGQADAVEWVRAAIDAQPEGALSGVVLFGADARVELTVAARDAFGAPAVVVDAGGTDLAGALRLAGAVLPSDARRRVVLVSDGRATVGDAAAEAARLAEAGIGLDVHTVDVRGGPDVAVVAIDTVGVAEEGEEVEITATVDATEAGPVTLMLERDGTVLDERTVDVAVGTTTVRFTDTPPAPGLYRYRVTTRAGRDSVLQNNVGYAAVEVRGPQRVLLVEGRDGNAASLATALRGAGIELDVAAVADLPPLDELTRYAATVLVDVDAFTLSQAQQDTLAAAVRDQGRGLVTLGGIHSYGLGGYLDSTLEELLPVISDVQDPERRKTVAEVLAIDTSGSMGNCHCADGATAANRLEAGVNKTDISRTAAARTIEALSDDDEVGVLAFDSDEDWVIPLQRMPSEDEVFDGLSSLRPSGGTDLSHSLTTSAEALRGSKASLKHIILFTDGFTAVNDMEALADQAEALFTDEGISVSVVATGEGAADDLRPIAERGGGRFYPGEDLSEIPQIMVQESLIASRDFINEGEFLPEITSSAPLVRDLDASPPLLGYVATTAKDTAATLLRIGADRDPLLASWQVGLGRATSWTSDGGEAWMQTWLEWDGFGAFWAGVVRDVYPVADGSAAVSARVDGDRLVIEVESEGPWPDGVAATARVTGPDLAGVEVPLERIDGQTFAAEVPLGDAGTYAVGALVSVDGETVYSGSTVTARSYSAEYEPGDARPDVLARLSTLTDGRGEITPAAAFDAGDLATGRSSLDLGPWLLAAAALAWPIAVALSRLAVRGSPMGTLVASVGSTVGSRAGRLRAAASRHVPTPPARADGGGPPRSAAPGAPPPTSSPPEPASAAPAPSPSPAPPATVGRLLERKRAGRRGDDDPPPG